MQSRRQALWRFMSLCLEKVFVQAQRTFLLTSCSYQHIMIFGGKSRRPIKHKIQRCCAAACRNDSDGGSGGGFKGTGCRVPRERHCKRKNVPRRRKPLGRKSVIADIMSVRRQVTNEERTLRGASQKTYIAEDRQQRALSPWCMDRQECAPTFPVWENAGVFSVAAPAGHSPWNGGRPVFFLHMDTSGRDGFSSRLLSIRAGGAKASPASSLSCTSNSRACGISTKRHLHHRKLLEYRCDPAARLAPSIPRRRRHDRQLRYGGTRRRTGVAEADNTETVENTGVPSKYLYAP